MKTKQKLIIIVGPTGSGKSELGVQLAKKYNGEIISADSRQVYRGLDIGTAKVSGAWVDKTYVYKKIAHYCIDVCSPKHVFSAADYQTCGRNAIRTIAGKGKIPFVVGGTGFWIDALIFGAFLPDVDPNPTLRKKFQKKSARELLAILEKYDLRRAATIEAKNPRRLIRAIEIAKAIGCVPEIQKKKIFSALWLGIRLPEKTLKKRLKKRLFAWIKRGLIGEGEKLRQNKISWKRIAELGFEYRALGDYARGKISKDQMIETIERGLWNYVRRQNVWFNKNVSIHWVENFKEAESSVKKFLEK